MQVYLGCSSRYVNGHGFCGKGEFPKSYHRFCTEEGAPSALRRDNAKEEDSAEVEKIQRELLIKDQFSEPHNQQQNPVEGGAIRWLKPAVHTLLDRVGAPNVLWFMAAIYLIDVWNRTWNSVIDMTPYQFRKGIVPDISILLQFVFFQKVLYLDHEQSWPSSSERSGRWVGIAHNVGDTLTHWILDDQSKRILARSVVRPFENNHQVKWDPGFINSLELKHTARHGGDVMPTREVIANKLKMESDSHDNDKPEPQQHPICVTKEVPNPKPNKLVKALLVSCLKQSRKATRNPRPKRKTTDEKPNAPEPKPPDKVPNDSPTPEAT